ncbi:MAG: lipoprotein signal peptidase [Burkholderiaceae bacterium]|nr:MAG: lipoprotein signal peptidase [Burkholderiaceae bacterium]
MANGWRWWALAAVVGITDAATKDWVRLNLFQGEVVPLTGFFNLVYFQNAGAAFSFLAGAGGWQKYLFIIIALVVAAVLTWALSIARPRTEAVAFSLILGGAIGNAVDRTQHSHVTDFLDFYWQNWHWPAFNVADIAICVGALILVCWTVFSAGGELRSKITAKQ